MSSTLESFAATCHDLLKAEPDGGGQRKICARLEEILKDRDFLAAQLGAHAEGERRILYRDPELGFCILAHVYKGPKSSSPHDHGPSWAIYGQALGETRMTEYRKLAAPKDGAPGLAAPVKTYTLKPGDAVYYEIGQLHAPERAGETRLIRIEGSDLSQVKRDEYRVVAG